jgi:hypothetical protein
MQDILGEGMIWGAVGALLVGTGSGAIQPNLRKCMLFVALANLIWAGASGFCFWVHLLAMASLGC